MCYKYHSSRVNLFFYLFGNEGGWESDIDTAREMFQRYLVIGVAVMPI